MRKKSFAKDIPPPLELECLKVLWKLGEGSVKDVRAQLAQRDLAYTTVMTILDRLEKRSAVSRKKTGRSFVYKPAIEREALRRLAVKELVDIYFDGDDTLLADWLKKTPALETAVQTESIFTESNFDTSLL